MQRLMKAYISGPINTDIPGTTPGSRKLVFNLCEKWVAENTDMEPVNPLNVGACIDIEAVKCELGLEDLNNHTWECWLRYDLIAMLECEAIVLLPGWTQSRGALLEHHLASQLGYKELIADEEGRIIG